MLLSTKNQLRQVAILRMPNEFGGETSCQQIWASFYLPVSCQLKWIRGYVGDKMCIADPENDFLVKQDKPRKHKALIAGLCFLFVYVITLSSLIWMDITKYAKNAENARARDDKKQPEEQPGLAKEAGENESQLNLEKSLKSDEIGSQGSLKPNKDAEPRSSLKE